MCGFKKKGGKQERMENMEAQNLPNGRTLTTRVTFINFVEIGGICIMQYASLAQRGWMPLRKA